MADETPFRHRLRRVWALLTGSGQHGPRSPRARIATFLTVTVAALMATVGAVAANGGDLRAGRNQDLSELVRARAAENKELASTMGSQRNELERLQKLKADDPQQAATLEKVALQAGARAVTGEAVRVVLDDAPPEVKPEGVDEDLLIVHQQDIQMVVNTFWAAGAEAMTVQGQRIITTTGIKCVGNSVVLHDIPYAPPYVIEAIGDPTALLAALDASPEVAIYQQYAEVYRLGWKQQRAGQVTMPAHAAPELTHARPPR